MSKGTIRRYTLIFEKLEKSNFPSFEEIKKFLNNQDFEVSNRTIQRDIEQIRNEFGLEILYDRNKNGYYIDKQNSIYSNSFPHFLEIANTAELLMESFKESKNALQHISFESNGELQGMQYLKPSLSAIKDQRKITLAYKNFLTDKTNRHSMQPYLLKQYQNRWYLIGLIDGMKEFRTFGLDRITELDVLDQNFERIQFDPKDLFENIVGLTYSVNKMEEIILALTPLQGKYVKSSPLHKSQQILEDTDKEFILKLKLIPNYEFKQRIMMMGEQVKVLKPDWLAEDVRISLESALQNY